MSMCEACQNMFHQAIPFEGPKDHHKSVNGLLEAAQLGCYVCARLINDLSDEQLECLKRLAPSSTGTDGAVTTVSIMDIPGRRSTPSSKVFMMSINQQNPLITSAAAAKGYSESDQGWLGRSATIALSVFHQSGTSSTPHIEISRRLS
jgi:hypothetical protein